jgi:hypothetical protein
MEQFIKSTDQLNLESIKSLASQKKLRESVKPNDTFYVPNPNLEEIEALLKENKIGFKKVAHPTYKLTYYTVLN